MGVRKMDEFMKAYSIKEVSKLIGVPEGTLRQWEKDFTESLIIPRDKQNARYYTEFEIETLKHIKSMREKGLSKKMIKELLKKQSAMNHGQKQFVEPSVPTLKQNEAIETLRNVQKAFEAFPQVKEVMVEELKNEIRSEIKNVVQKEIASGLESGNKHTSEQIKTLSESLNAMESNYKKEIERRDQALMENMNLMKEIKKNQSKGILKRIFSSKN